MTCTPLHVDDLRHVNTTPTAALRQSQQPVLDSWLQRATLRSCVSRADRTRRRRTSETRAMRRMSASVQRNEAEERKCTIEQRTCQRCTSACKCHRSRARALLTTSDGGIIAHPRRFDHPCICVAGDASSARTSTASIRSRPADLVPDALPPIPFDAGLRPRVPNCCTAILQKAFRSLPD